MPDAAGPDGRAGGVPGGRWPVGWAKRRGVAPGRDVDMLACLARHPGDPVHLAVAATVFAIIFPAELPDKTALASLILGSRFRAAYVFAGVAAAFAVHAALAVTAGGLLSLLPRRPLEVTVAVLFAAGAVLVLRGRRGHDSEQVDLRGRPPGFWRVAVTSFGVILVAEFGDLTQIATATLAARYHDPVWVGVGAVLGLWAVAALAIGYLAAIGFFRSNPPPETMHARRSAHAIPFADPCASLTVTTGTLTAARCVKQELGVAQLDLAGAGQEHAERDGVRVVRDQRGDLVRGPAAVAVDGDNVISRVGQGDL
ncbi:MAG TPA: TMEM165/GDT1 family protein [Streptosporangiaceae bacterium]